jgi:hypothetical protein
MFSAKNLAGLAVQVVANAMGQVQDDAVVPGRTADPGEDFAPVELMANRLLFLPRQEFGQDHSLQWQAHFRPIEQTSPKPS